MMRAFDSDIISLRDIPLEHREAVVDWLQIVGIEREKSQTGEVHEGVFLQDYYYWLQNISDQKQLKYFEDQI